jgi:hypothetical protein
MIWVNLNNEGRMDNEKAKKKKFCVFLSRDDDYWSALY